MHPTRANPPLAPPQNGIFRGLDNRLTSAGSFSTRLKKGESSWPGAGAEAFVDRATDADAAAVVAGCDPFLAVALRLRLLLSVAAAASAAPVADGGRECCSCPNGWRLRRIWMLAVCCGWWSARLRLLLLRLAPEADAAPFVEGVSYGSCEADAAPTAASDQCGFGSGCWRQGRLQLQLVTGAASFSPGLAADADAAPSAAPGPPTAAAPGGRLQPRAAPAAAGSAGCPVVDADAAPVVAASATATVARATAGGCGRQSFVRCGCGACCG